MRRAGLEGYRLHDASHARIGITLDTYSHVTPGLQEAAALRFEDAMAEVHRQEVVPGGHTG